MSRSREISFLHFNEQCTLLLATHQDMTEIGSFWTKRSLMTEAIVFIAAVMTAIVVITISMRSREPPVEVCNTQACLDTARTFLTNMNRSVDPCEDFYDYACGRYAETHKLPPDQSLMNEFREIRKTVRRRIQGLFDNISKDQEKVSPIKFVKTFYNQCKDKESLNKHGLEVLHNIIKGFGNWSDVNSRNKEENLVHALTQYGVGAIFSISVASDPFDPNRQVLSIESPSFIISREDLRGEDEKSKKIVEAYKKFIRQTAELLGRNQIASDIDKIVEFEKKLAKVTTPRAELRDPFKSIHKMTLGAVKDIVSEIDIPEIVLQILKKLDIKKNINPMTTVIVYDLEYLKKFGRILHETPPQTINNYLGLRLIAEFGRMTTDKFRENILEYTKVATGVKAAKKWEDDCADKAHNLLSMVVGRLYIEKYFTKEEKEASEGIVKDILNVFKENIPRHNWLDNVTRIAAADKANSVMIKMAFPKWIMDNNELAKEYPLEPSKGTALENLFIASRMVIKKKFKKLDTPTDWNKYWFGPAVVNAYYFPKQNSINFPAGFLQGLVFNSSRPAYLNYGAFGAVAGHEVSHAFDDSGSKFGKNGNLHNWWTDKSRKNFESKAECFKDQYGSIVDKQTGLNLNGKLTLGENIADNGGVNVAFTAWRRVWDKPFNRQLLPGMEDWTTDQLFFISYANSYCSNLREEYTRSIIQSDAHSPYRYRVNLPLMNSQAFAKAFQCKEGTRMNPKDKCAIW